MTVVTELTIAEGWIYERLATDSTLQTTLGVSTEAEAGARIWSGTAPSGTPFKYIIVQRQSGRDINGLGNRLARIMSSALFQVVAYDEGPQWGDLAPIARRIDELLHGKAGTLLDDDMTTVLGTVLSCVREQPFSLTETVEGKQYRRLGGLYRLQVQEGAS